MMLAWNSEAEAAFRLWHKLYKTMKLRYTGSLKEQERLFHFRCEPSVINYECGTVMPISKASFKKNLFYKNGDLQLNLFCFPVSYRILNFKGNCFHLC